MKDEAEQPIHPSSLILHPFKEPAVGVAPTSTALRVRRLSISSHTGIPGPSAEPEVQARDESPPSLALRAPRTRALPAGAQGFEPSAAVLEAACSPRSTLLKTSVSGGN